MISLFIDTSNFKLLVGVVDEDNNKILSFYNEEVKGDMSSKALCVIRDSLDQLNLKPQSVDKIYVVNGPGSFTGVRIGVTIAKTFAWALKKTIIPISSLELLASTEADTDYVAGLIDARRDAVYAGIYSKNLDTYYEDRYVTLDELKTAIPSSTTLISDDNINLEGIKESNVDILKVISKHKNDMGVDPHHLNPSYLKITEAEANLNKKND